MASKKTQRQFLMCINNAGYPASLEMRKIYVAFVDSEAEAKGFVRVIDESGEDYLYPQSFFIAVDLPKEAEKCVLSSAK